MLGRVTHTARKGFAHPAVRFRCILIGIDVPLIFPRAVFGPQIVLSDKLITALDRITD